MFKRIGALFGGILCAVAFMILLSLAEVFLPFQSFAFTLLRYLCTVLLAVLGVFMIVDSFVNLKWVNDDDIPFSSERARKVTYLLLGIAVLLIAGGITVLGFYF